MPAESPRSWSEWRLAAMAAGISDKLWLMDDIVARIEAREHPPKKRGPYKKRAPKLESAISN